MNYDNFYRKQVNNRPAHYQKPFLVKAKDFALRSSALYHSLGEDRTSLGPLPADIFLAYRIALGQTIMINPITELATLTGRPRPLPGVADREIRKYHQRYRNLRPMKRRELVLADNKISMVNNYALLYHNYRYTRSALSDYSEALNIFHTLTKEIRSMTQQSSKPQFLQCYLPDTLPEQSQFVLAGRRKDKTTLEPFKDFWSFFALFVWESLGQESGAEGPWPKTGHDKIHFFWEMTNELLFLRLDGFTALQEKNPKLAQSTFYNLLTSMKELAEARQVRQPDSLLADEIEPEFQLVKADLSTAVMNVASHLADSGQLSAAEFRRAQRLSEAHQKLPALSGSGTLVEQAARAHELARGLPETMMPTLPTSLDPSMAKSLINGLDSYYVKDIYQGDIAGMILALQNSGIPVTDVKVSHRRDAMNENYDYSVKLTPIDGAESTIHFQLPALSEDGSFISNGSKCRLDKQRGDMPIRKVRSDRVALTSYYGKAFVDRDPRVSFNFERWLTGQLYLLSQQPDSGLNVLSMSHVFDHRQRAPRVYTAMATRIDWLEYNDLVLNFNIHKREKICPAEELARWEKGGGLVCGRTKKGAIITVDFDNIFYRHQEGKTLVIGTVNDLFDGKLGSAPVSISVMKVRGQTLSLGFIMAYFYGLQKLLNMLKVERRTVSKGTRLVVDETELAIVFADETLIVNKTDPKVSMILGGLNLFHKSLRRFQRHDFNRPAVYLNVLADYGMGMTQLKELELLQKMFVDPITEEILKDIKEPTTFDGLLLRANELLILDDHPKETDMASMRIRGNERLPGLVYAEMVKAIRRYHNQSGKDRKVELNPRSVWMEIAKDSSKTLCEDINPVQTLKEREKVNYSGLGGRDSTTMVRRSREYQENDLGIISEAGVDSGKVGIISALSADPKLANMRGIASRYDRVRDGASSQFSTTAMLLPLGIHDDAKRVSFSSIQYTHVVAIAGNGLPAVRTGYENLMAYRAGPYYNLVAEQAGVILRKDERVVIIRYKDGQELSYPLGRKFAKVSDIRIPHDMVCDREAGYKFQAGEVLAFNQGFFRRDYFTPKQVAMLCGYMATTALMESNDTLEDSCAVSEHMARQLSTEITYPRYISVRFDQVIHNLVKVGEEVESDSVLCTIEDAVTADSQIFDDESIGVLNILSANAPKARQGGRIERIEVIYYGLVDNMNADLLRTVKSFDKKRAEEERLYRTQKAESGELMDSVLIDGKATERDTVVFTIFISKRYGTGVGDKAVFANQLKTTIGRNMVGVNETESGVPIDAIFGYQSIANRITLSPDIMGCNNTAMRAVSEHFAKLYFGD